LDNWSRTWLRATSAASSAVMLGVVPLMATVE
jgi:hypothetical protein